MATIRPFKGIRPRPDMAEKVAALPYDVVNSSEAREMTKGNPFSFLHVDKAEIDLCETVDHYDLQVYEKASANLKKLISDGILISDEKPEMYIYKLTMDGRSQSGLVVCTSIDEYIDGTIKKHEFTRADKEEDRIRHVDYCNANTGPIFLAYRAKNEISAIIEGYEAKNVPVYDFTAEDGIGHCVWVVSDTETINRLTELFAEVPNLYIADGHHRNASAVKVGLKRRAELLEYTGEEEFNFYLSVLFPDTELKIFDYNRVVKDLNGLSHQEFLEELSKVFSIEEVEGICKPEVHHSFGMYLGKKWYRLTAKAEVIGSGAVESLDVSILQDCVLIPILGIKDIRTDSRIDFIGGIRGLSELEKRVDSGEMEVAFSMYPTSMGELFKIADMGEIMPPKSTWFEPKLRSGLFIHSLSN